MQFRIPVTREILNLVTRVDLFRGSWSGGASIPLKRRERLEHDAGLRSAILACRQGGIRVGPEVEEHLRNGESDDFRGVPEVNGYLQALAWHFPRGSRLFDTERMRRLHATLIGEDGDPPEPSPWRGVNFERELFDETGQTIGLVMQTMPPRLVPQTTEDLVTWLEIELRSREHHALLVIGTFVLALLAVSPFPRGNGRLASVLAVQLLEHAGYDYVRCASLEQALYERREEFPPAFDLSQTRLWTGEGDLGPWLVFFLRVVEGHSGNVAKLVRDERAGTRYTPLQRAILEAVRENGTVAAGQLIQATGANRNTLKDNLRRLVRQGVLEKMGERRGARYRLRV